MKRPCWKKEKCAYCGSKEDLPTDHIISLIKEGLDRMSNKVLSCKKCNCSKLDKDIFE
jgi:5-methylcytosine-specific restriction endonuclease McrA